MKNLFDIFKSKLANSKFDDKEKHWKELEQLLNANDSKKGGFFLSNWMIVSIIGISGLALMYALTNNIAGSFESNDQTARTKTAIVEKKSPRLENQQHLDLVYL